MIHMKSVKVCGVPFLTANRGNLEIGPCMCREPQMCFQAEHEVEIRGFEDACKQTLTHLPFLVPVQVKTYPLELKMSERLRFVILQKEQKHKELWRKTTAV